MSDKTKQQLKIENNTSFPNNNTGFITPDKLRTFNENVIDSFLVNDYTASNDATIADLSGSFNDFTQSYYVDSASFDSRISAVDTSSYVTQTEFDTFETQSNQRLDSIEQFTASIDDDFVSEAELAAATGALENEIATKADQTDFTAYTSSNDSRVSSIENFTSSVETKFDTLATTTSSLQDFTASADSRLTNIESNTSSYARVDTTNQFQETQTLEQDLVVQGNLYVSGAEVIISSSELIVGDRIIEVNANKVIGDAGLYAFDAIGDQTGSLIWNPTLDYWLAGLSGSEEKVLVSSDTGSITNSITNLETFTQSAEGRLDNIELTTQSLEEKNNTLETFTQSLYQTASNDFSEITLTKVDGTTQVLDTTPRQVWETVKNGNGQQLPKGTPVYASGSVGNAQLVFPASASDATTMPAVYILAQTLDPDEEGLGYTHGFINGVNTSLFDAGDAIYVGINGGYTNQPPTGSTNLIQKLGTVVRSDVNNGSGVIQIDSVRDLPNIQEGYLWVGDSDGVPQQIATSSIEESTDLSSLNSFTQSAEGRLDNIELTTASLEDSVSQLNQFTSSVVPISTGSLLVTASISLNTITFTKGNGDTFDITVDTGSATDISSLNAFTASAEIRLTNLETFTSSQETTNTELFASSSIFAEKFDTIETQSGSWGGGGGGGFPYEGDAQISGSLGVTGSFSGDVVTLTAVSSTASINMNDGNFFTLDIPTGTTTHIDFTNIRAGQVINLQTTQPTTTGSLEFSPSVKFAGGYPFIATTTGSAIDFITFVSLDGTNILGTGIKNFL